MIPYETYDRLMFTCVDGPMDDVVNTIMARYTPENTYPARYYSKPVELDFSLAYSNERPTDGRPSCLIFWEPSNRHGSTAFMGSDVDGMSTRVHTLSADSPYCWVNLRIRDQASDSYPGCFFHYFQNFRNVERVIEACRSEAGWYFDQEGPVQAFENPEYYTRKLKRERFNRTIATDYMNQLGFRIAENEFWKTDRPATYVWMERPWLKNG